MLNRRKFIRQASCAALGTTTFFNTLINLKTLNAAAISNSTVANGEDYKALVCVLLEGGNDSFNMLIPTETTAYSNYATTRSNLAIANDQILPLSGVNYGVHPSLGNVQTLFNANKLAFISNIGTLIEPVTKPEIYNDSANLPLGLFSHLDQIQQWQTSVPHDRAAIGWGGKVADLLASTNANPNISTNITLSGSNLFQRGNNTVEYAVDPEDGSKGIIGYNGQYALNQVKTAAIDNMIDANYADIFKKTYVDVIKVSRDAHVEFSAALDDVGQLSTNFSNTDLSQSFNMIARTIAARQTLGMQRQIFFVRLGGFDTHDELLNDHTELLTELNDALWEFDQALTEINANDCVTTFTMSEFGRTLTSNGNGTDHAWGGNVMVMGDNVIGGNIYGTYPSLSLEGNDLNLGEGGVLIPTTSADEYFAELALWFGVSPSDLSTVFPNIGNFYSMSSGVMPIGFLG